MIKDVGPPCRNLIHGSFIKTRPICLKSTFPEFASWTARWKSWTLQNRRNPTRPRRKNWKKWRRRADFPWTFWSSKWRVWFLRHRCFFFFGFRLRNKIHGSPFTFRYGLVHRFQGFPILPMGKLFGRLGLPFCWLGAGRGWWLKVVVA